MNFWERDSYSQTNAKNQRQSQQSGTQSQNAKSQSFQDAYSRYASQSEEELMSELLRVASQMKGNGTFDVGALEALYENSKGYLNDSQLARMRALIDMLKGDGNGSI